MSVTVHQRPGVYSSYDAVSVTRGRSRGGVVGLVGVDLKAPAGVVEIMTSYDRAVTAFHTGAPEGMAELVRLALGNGASAVAAVAVADSGHYAEGFAALEQLEEVSVVLCDSTDEQVQQAMRDSVERASGVRRERIAVAACPRGADVEACISRAKKLNHERVVLAAPGCVDRQGEELSGLLLAAAMAGALAGERDPAVPLGGAELRGLFGMSRQFQDGELDRLILGGVTVAESLAGTVSVIRGVTTRTTTGGEADPTWRELTTIRVVDEVIPGLRETLRTRFRRAKNTARSREAIRAQVVLELEHRLEREIITGYENVAVTADPEEPTRCLVDFSFTAAHGLNQIWLTAHIAV